MKPKFSAMKMKIALLTLLGMISSLAFAQSVEYDDMYFNRKDREKLRENIMASNQTRTGQRVATNTSKNEQMSRFNPTDSYSARSVNPDAAQNLNSSGKRNEFADDEYLPEEYADGYRSAQMAKSNNNFHNSGFYGPRFSAWNSPYFGMGGMYDPWMMGAPMWGGNSMMAMSMGFGWGNPYMGSGMMWRNSSMFWRNSFMMDPFNSWAWDPFWNPYMGMGGMGMAFGGWGNPYWGNPYWGGRPWGHTTVVIVGDSHNSHISRARRPSRGGSFNDTNYNNTDVRSRDRNNVVVNDMNRTNNSGRLDNTRNTTVNRFDSRQGTTTRSNINTYQSRTSSNTGGVAPSSRQRIQPYSPTQTMQQNTRSYSPSNMGSSGMRSTGSSSSMGTIGSGASRSAGSSVGSSSSSGGSSGGSRSRGGN
jgi:hypothetical protein